MRYKIISEKNIWVESYCWASNPYEAIKKLREREHQNEEYYDPFWLIKKVEGNVITMQDPSIINTLEAHFCISKVISTIKKKIEKDF